MILAVLVKMLSRMMSLALSGKIIFAERGDTESHEHS